jgi:hypothetical protein
MVTAYGRPFTANQGLGSLLVEYPAYPDFPDAEMNDRHKRLIDLRNKFHAHSSLEGTKTWLLTPGSVNPRSNEAVTDYGVVTAKLHVNDKRFATWLHDAVNALLARLETDIVAKWKIVGSAQLQHGQFLLLESDKPFQWTP